MASAASDASRRLSAGIYVVTEAFNASLDAGKLEACTFTLVLALFSCQTSDVGDLCFQQPVFGDVRVRTKVLILLTLVNGEPVGAAAEVRCALACARRGAVYSVSIAN